MNLSEICLDHMQNPAANAAKSEVQKRCITLLEYFNKATRHSNHQLAAKEKLSLSKSKSPPPKPITKLPSFGSNGSMSPNSPPENLLAASEPTSCLPHSAEILSTTNNVQRLISHLTPPTVPAVTAQVWDLLKCIPISEDIRKEVKDCFTKNQLEKFLKQDTLYLSLYKLHILEHLFLQEVQKTCVAGGQQPLLIIQFNEQGGVHIIQLLQDSFNFIGSRQNW